MFRKHKEIFTGKESLKNYVYELSQYHTFGKGQLACTQIIQKVCVSVWSRNTTCPYKVLTVVPMSLSDLTPMPIPYLFDPYLLLTSLLSYLCFPMALPKDMRSTLTMAFALSAFSTWYFLPPDIQEANSFRFFKTLLRYLLNEHT